jgi:UDP-2-acetamido-2-deoxy-ribo-hexuluronate aminotransferase
MEFIDLKKQYSVIKDKVQKRIEKVLESAQFILGPEIQEVENKLKEFVQAKHCVTVASGTDALYVALLALNIGRDHEVITTPFSFIATSEVIALCGARPIFVDIDPKTYNIDPFKIEKAITNKTKAILPVSLFGQCADMDAINEIGRKHRLPVIEDAAQCFGATYKGKSSCALAVVGVTSFFPAKPLGCYGDGGAIFTEDDALAEKFRQIRVHGQSRRYYHETIGFNARFDTLQAAILLEKLAIFPSEVAQRAKLGKYYSENLSKKVITPHIEEHNTHVFAQYTIQVDDRDMLIEKLKEKGIPTAVHYPVPLHMQPAFKYLGYRESDFPISERVASKVISLPMHPYLERTDQDLIIQTINSIY